MITAPIPRTETERLLTLLALDVLDTSPEAEFDALVRVASQVCDVPISLISLIDAERQWFKANIGLPGASETHRDVAFCSHAILNDTLLEVTDATKDIRFSDNPLVTGDPCIRFYAGAPVTMSNGHRVGTLCIIDRQPRHLDDMQRDILSSLARVAAATLEGRRAERQHKKNMLSLQASQNHLRCLYESTPAMMHSIDMQGRLQTVSDMWLSKLGYTREDMVGQFFYNFMTPASRDYCRNIVLPDFLRSGQCDNISYQIISKSGIIIDILLSGITQYDADRTACRGLIVAEDVTERLSIERQLAQQHELLKVTLNSIGDAVITTDTTGNVTWLNPVAEHMTGWDLNSAVGHPLTQIFHIVDEETRKPIENPVTTCLGRSTAICLSSHTILISREGEEFGIEDSAAPIRNPQGEMLGVVLVFHDVTEQRRLSGEMSYRATHDALTGLVNRTEFETRLRKILHNSHKSRSEHTLLYIDLDKFKLVNDSCGHAIGDQLLQQISKLLHTSVRDLDTLARLGGDEFGIILEQCTAEPAQRIAQQICDRMDDFRFVHDGRRFRIGASIGLVPVDSRWAATEAIMQAADTSCYAAKEAGRNRVHTWFDSDLAMRTRHNEMQWTDRIGQALDEDRFTLYAQHIVPLNDTADGIHAEVLLRMIDTDGSLIPPGAFLPAAERFHLASRIDRWVLRQSINWIQRAKAADAIENLSINLSGQSIGDRAFHRWAMAIFTEAGPHICRKLCIEITETAVVTNLADAALFIEQVRASGIRVALDDFGAGASSFGYLKSLPVDYIKVDGQFIRNITNDSLDEAAVRCFTDVAKVIGVKTVAEFVENDVILERLKLIGIDFVQGYLIHRPAPINELLLDLLIYA